MTRKLLPYFLLINLGWMISMNAIATKQSAIFAGGCFWCMQKPFDQQAGVIDTIVGYTGGHIEDPTYEQVSDGDTGHREAIQVIYDPERVSYEKLLEIFWHNVDPVDPSGQFCDKGFQYTSAIFYADEQQKKQAIASQQALEQNPKFAEVYTEIIAATIFYPAEDYHQDYYKKNPVRYKFYRYSCGRDKRLQQVWGKS